MVNPKSRPAASKNPRDPQEQIMNRYQPSNLRPLFGIAAVAMTALTLAVSVVIPANLAPAAQEAGRFAAGQAAAPATEVAISPARIDVIGLRETNLADSPVRDAAPRSGQRG
jgi:hypothetical protein